MCLEKIKNCFRKPSVGFFLETYKVCTQFLEIWIMSVLVLLMRLWMARIFWYSGLTKISSWESTLYLFEYEYQVPFLSVQIAAYCATFFELVCPVFLTIGLLTRFASLPLLVMTLVIQFTYLDATDHYHWFMILSCILCYGPGKFSLDNLLCKFWQRCLKE